MSSCGFLGSACWRRSSLALALATLCGLPSIAVLGFGVVKDGHEVREEPVVYEVQMFKVSVHQLHFGSKVFFKSDLNNSLPFNKYAYLTTHNSFAIVGEPSHTGIPRISFDNQEDTVTDQLNNGVRALMLDTYDFKRGVWLCHSSGGKCNDFTAFEPALDTFKEIRAFLSANPSEIVTLILEDYVRAPNGLTNVFKASGLQKYWFPVSKMPKNGHEWPLVSDMVRSNQRLLVFTSARSKQSAPLNDKTKSLVLMNYFPSVPMKLTACLQHSRGLADMANTCYGAAGNRWANFIAVDYYKRSEGGGAFQATDLLNGMLLCGCQDVRACQGKEVQVRGVAGGKVGRGGRAEEDEEVNTGGEGERRGED
ncbi:hypothetical protein ZWY2020_046125 [Hordeum vulgare]|nr:hypothetical protein ZWY2020_046125 [Hordeum vulgare]